MLQLTFPTTWNHTSSQPRIRFRLPFFSHSPTLAPWTKSRAIQEPSVTTCTGTATATKPRTPYARLGYFFIYQTARHGPQNGFRTVSRSERFPCCFGDDIRARRGRRHRSAREGDSAGGNVEVVVLGSELTAACGSTDSSQETSML